MSDEMFSMADFEKVISEGMRPVNPGDMVKGVVIGISDTEVTVDLNYYAEGIVKIDELSNDPHFSIKADVHVGDEISAVVIREDRNGNILLSMKQADNILSWDKLKQLKADKTVVSVKVRESVNAGAIAYVEGIRGFIPAGKLALDYVEDTSSYVGNTLDVIVITVDEEAQKLVLSAKDVIRDNEIIERNMRAARLPIGTVTEGVINRLEQYGAFVDIGNDLTGLVHISEICNKRIKSAREVLELGQKVKVKLIDVKEGKLSLSIKAVEEYEEPEEIEEADPMTITIGDDDTVTMGSLFANIKLTK